MVGFSIAAFFSCFIATIMSIIDSIGDYYACARVSRVPPPPAHAVNRGILVEGLCTFFSGAVGVGHATSTTGGNIGAIGITKVWVNWNMPKVNERSPIVEQWVIPANLGNIKGKGQQIKA